MNASNAAGRAGDHAHGIRRPPVPGPSRRRPGTSLAGCLEGRTEVGLVRRADIAGSDHVRRIGRQAVSHGTRGSEAPFSSGPTGGLTNGPRRRQRKPSFFNSSGEMRCPRMRAGWTTSAAGRVRRGRDAVLRRPFRVLSGAGATAYADGPPGTRGSNDTALTSAHTDWPVCRPRRSTDSRVMRARRRCAGAPASASSTSA